MFQPPIGEAQVSSIVVESESVELACVNADCSQVDDVRFLDTGGLVEVEAVISSGPLDVVLNRSPSLVLDGFSVVYDEPSDRLIAAGTALSVTTFPDDQFVRIVDGLATVSIGVNDAGDLSGQDNRITIQGTAEQIGATGGTLLTVRVLEIGYDQSVAVSNFDFKINIDGGDLQSDFPTSLFLSLEGQLPTTFLASFMQTDRVRAIVAPNIEGRVLRASLESFAGSLDDAPVTEIDLGGLYVTVTTAVGEAMRLRTYGANTPQAFRGRDDLPNEPVSRSYVSGERFVSTNSSVQTGDNFEEVGPIRFEFSSPVSAFGFSTIDLLELPEEVFDSVSVFAIARGDDDLFDVDEHSRFNRGAQSGVVLPWVVRSSENLDVFVTLEGMSQSSSLGGYGLDDFFVIVSDDSDQDGVPFELDNCVFRPNANQRDTDSDGLGNACDADLNNDCIVNAVDLGLLRSRFFSDNPDADFDGDGTVNVIDLGIMRLAFFRAPGFSGIANLCKEP